LIKHVSRGLSGSVIHWLRDGGAVARRGFSAIPEQKLVAFVLALIAASQHRSDTTPYSGLTLRKAMSAPVPGGAPDEPRSCSLLRRTNRMNSRRIARQT
jgi:hypothetical protein